MLPFQYAIEHLLNFQHFIKVARRIETVCTRELQCACSFGLTKSSEGAEPYLVEFSGVLCEVRSWVMALALMRFIALSFFLRGFDLFLVFFG